MKYRIITDRFAGFEVQGRLDWIPVWFEVGWANTSSTPEKAKEWLRGRIERNRKRCGDVVEYFTIEDGPK